MTFREINVLEFRTNLAAPARRGSKEPVTFLGDNRRLIGIIGIIGIII